MKNKTVLKVLISSLGTFLLLSGCTGNNVKKSESSQYRKAIKLIEKGQYNEAYDILYDLGDYKDSKNQADSIKNQVIVFAYNFLYCNVRAFIFCSKGICSAGV